MIVKQPNGLYAIWSNVLVGVGFLVNVGFAYYLRRQ